MNNSKVVEVVEVVEVVCSLADSIVMSDVKTIDNAKQSQTDIVMKWVEAGVDLSAPSEAAYPKVFGAAHAQMYIDKEVGGKKVNEGLITHFIIRGEGKDGAFKAVSKKAYDAETRNRKGLTSIEMLKYTPLSDIKAAYGKSCSEFIKTGRNKLKKNFIHTANLWLKLATERTAEIEAAERGEEKGDSVENTRTIRPFEALVAWLLYGEADAYSDGKHNPAALMFKCRNQCGDDAAAKMKTALSVAVDLAAKDKLFHTAKK
jgi:hypothetical protein